MRIRVVIWSGAISVPERRRILNFLGRVLNGIVAPLLGGRGCNWGAVAVVGQCGVGARRLSRARTRSTDSAAPARDLRDGHRRAAAPSPWPISPCPGGPSAALSLRH
jgi:hypothetical protein